ncbi:bifunctional Aminoacyl-tRNA synthetase [Babesia duncani]|uniref:tyrosine--tRNA ligase n=1 Tax=Babesia duncani TaxID=323732 RepID=A0AAD9PJE7_9APIC|nr:bifunctional Aminoacyl-tRNA synthetase [Babesia duncani]
MLDFLKMILPLLLLQVSHVTFGFRVALNSNLKRHHPLPLKSHGVVEAFSGSKYTPQSQLLSQLAQRDLIAQTMHFKNLDAWLCERESNMHATPVPSVYCGIDITSDHIHEGTLVQLMLLRRFLSHGFNALVVIGGGTTLVGDPSFNDTRRQNNKVLCNDTKELHNPILNCKLRPLQILPNNELSIINAVSRILQAPLPEFVKSSQPSAPVAVTETERIPKIPKIFEASKITNEQLKEIACTTNNVVILNNYDLYKQITLSQYLETVARNLSLGRMLSRESIKARMSSYNQESKLDHFQCKSINMDLSELLYMSLQALDFVHVASKYNVRVQIGGSDQMGNIMTGIELAGKLNAFEYDLFGITTPLLSNSDGSKAGKSTSSQIQLCQDSTPLDIWCRFRNVTDDSCLRLLEMLSDIPLETINDAVSKHINDAKIMLADYMVTLLYGKETTQSIHQFWLSRKWEEYIALHEQTLEPELYKSLLLFLKMVPHCTLDKQQLQKGIEFGYLLNQLRKAPQSGNFYGNGPAIREGICSVGINCISDPKARITTGDLHVIKSSNGDETKFIPIKFGKRQIFIAFCND